VDPPQLETCSRVTIHRFVAPSRCERERLGYSFHVPCQQPDEFIHFTLVHMTHDLAYQTIGFNRRWLLLHAILYALHIDRNSCAPTCVEESRMVIAYFGNTLRTQSGTTCYISRSLSHERPGPGEGPDGCDLVNDHGYHSSPAAHSTEARTPLKFQFILYVYLGFLALSRTRLLYLT
jgi:hypothetical protein